MARGGINYKAKEVWIRGSTKSRAKENRSQGKTYLKTLVPKSKTSTMLAYNLRFKLWLLDINTRKETERNTQYSLLYSGFYSAHIILNTPGK